MCGVKTLRTVEHKQIRRLRRMYIEIEGLVESVLRPNASFGFVTAPAKPLWNVRLVNRVSEDLASHRKASNVVLPRSGSEVRRMSVEFGETAFVIYRLSIMLALSSLVKATYRPSPLIFASANESPVGSARE